MKNSIQESVVLVDEQDRFLGEMEKNDAHRKGVLHRAISVFIFNDKGELLLQRRALIKYHSGGLWTNTCCTHPRINESITSAASRRLSEEMGITATAEKAFDFIYRRRVNDSMIENELDHVMIGYCNAVPLPKKEEVSEWKYLPMDVIEGDLKANSKRYTVWFQICFDKVQQYLNKSLS